MKKVILLPILLLFFLSGSIAQVTINNDGSASDPSAMLDVKSTTRGFLPPRMTQTQRSAIASPPEGLVVICTDCSGSGGADLTVFLGGNWYSIGKQPQWSCGMPITITHTIDSIAPVDKLVSYGTVTGIPGETDKCWITRNLGASQQATSVSDATEASAGWYWQFNRKQGHKHDGTTLTPSWTITSISEDSNWQAANDPCNLELGSQWRIPTSTEWINVMNTGGWNNWNGPWNSGLKMHAAGTLAAATGSLANRGSAGYYWSSTQNSQTAGWVLLFGSGVIYMNSLAKPWGFSVRCLRD